MWIILHYHRNMKTNYIVPGQCNTLCECVWGCSQVLCFLLVLNLCVSPSKMVKQSKPLSITWKVANQQFYSSSNQPQVLKKTPLRVNNSHCLNLKKLLYITTKITHSFIELSCKSTQYNWSQYLIHETVINSNKMITMWNKLMTNCLHATLRVVLVWWRLTIALPAPQKGKHFKLLLQRFQPRGEFHFCRL